MTRVGAMFAGYGGLELGLGLTVPDARTVWVAETNPMASKVLAARFPHAPNLGDVRAVDWASAPPVDVLTGGSPCQDLSQAGERLGMMPGTRSGLWESMTHAIAELRPSWVVWENVKGALSARAYSALEPNEGRVGITAGKPAIRALGRVLGDLANLGYDATWCGLRASDVGAPHQRFRIFVLAWPADAHGERIVRRRPPPKSWGKEPADRDRGPAAEPLTPLPAAVLLPTPAVNDDDTGDDGGDPSLDWWDDWAPRYAPAMTRWDTYAPAITRWETVLGRPAPEPTEPTGKGDTRRLAPRFVEWLMGLPDGWVTDVDGLNRQGAFTVLGNGVVPQQAAAALDHLWAVAHDLSSTSREGERAS